MKRRKLRLSRETLGTLTGSGLRRAAGGRIERTTRDIPCEPMTYDCPTYMCPTDLCTIACPTIICPTNQISICFTCNLTCDIGCV